MADLIDKKAVMESITAEYNRKGTGDGLRLAWIEKAVNSVPPVSPQQKVGRWIDITDHKREIACPVWECSLCGVSNFLYDRTNYCPNCGAKMEVE